jgi:hypothetical protein
MSPGKLWFGSATLPQAWRDWASNASEHEVRPVLDELFRRVASTAIDKKGVAREHTLRVVEVVVPLTLRAEVLGPDDDPGWARDMDACLPFLRALGSRRHRGYGRVSVTMEVC